MDAAVIKWALTGCFYTSVILRGTTNGSDAGDMIRLTVGVDAQGRTCVEGSVRVNEVGGWVDGGYQQRELHLGQGTGVDTGAARFGLCAAHSRIATWLTGRGCGAAGALGIGAALTSGVLGSCAGASVCGV